jgi:hypothetical protein
MLALLLVLLFVGGLVAILALMDMIQKLQMIEMNLNKLINNLKKMNGDRIV